MGRGFDAPIRPEIAVEEAQSWGSKGGKPMRMEYANPAPGPPRFKAQSASEVNVDVVGWVFGDDAEWER